MKAGGTISTQALSDLLLTLYSAPQSPDQWSKFLGKFVRLLGVSGAGIVCQDEKRINYGYSATFGLDPEGIQLYHTHYGKQDPQIPPISEIVPGGISLGPELCPREYFRRTEYFNDFARKYDISLYCAVPTCKTRCSVEAVTLYTGFADGRPGKEALDFVALMVPHLQSALSLRRRFVDMHSLNFSLESSLNLLEAGVVLLDHRGNVLLMNRAAEGLLDSKDGFFIQAGRLFASIRSESVRLDALIGTASRTGSRTGTQSSGSMRVSRASKSPLGITVAPLLIGSRWSFARSAAAVVFIHDGEQKTQTPCEWLTQMFGLTPAEAWLSLKLVEGCSLKEAAELCGVTHNTVRSQLRSIFLKTGAHHQGELIRLLLPVCLTTKG